jgi:hypothetical protein
MKRLLSVLGMMTAVSFAMVPTRLPAQDHLSVRIVPRAGLTNPDSYLYEEFVSFAADAPTEWTTGSLGRAAYVGLGMEVGREDRGILLRGEVAHTFDGWLSVVHGIVIPRVLFDPPRIVNTYLDVPADITFASLQIVLPMQFELGGVRPYGLVGGGGKWYHFGSPTEPNTVEAILPSDGFTGALELGGGVSFSLFGLLFDAQARDSINRYWGKTQHDLVFSGALVWRIR